LHRANLIFTILEIFSAALVLKTVYKHKSITVPCLQLHRTCSCGRAVQLASGHKCVKFLEIFF